MLFLHLVYVYKKGKPSKEEIEKFRKGLKEARKQKLL
jgi:hypothetical protein